MQCLYVFIMIMFSVVSLEAFLRVERAATANCPKITDFPGRIKYRRKGTRAAFKCPKKFDRYGAKNADCQADGTWSDPPPLCLKAGCLPIDPSQQPNLDMEVVNGALVRFSCIGNYKLIGSKEVYCDGVDWSAALPRCAAPHELTECDFEEDLCGWTQDDADHQDWTRISGPTQTGNTGPKYDHTYGASKSGHYIFFEASAPTAVGDEAKLLSPVYTPDLSPMCFDFWYHILGPDEVGHVGSLEVSVIDQSQFEEDIQPMFVKEGNQGDQWLRGEIFIDKQDEPFQIMIVAKRALSYFSDIAIDDVRLYDCTVATKATKHVPTGSTTESTTESSTTESTTETTTKRKIRPTKPKPGTTKKPTPQPPTPQPSIPQPTTIATTMKPTTQTTPKLPELTSTTTIKTTTEPTKIPTSTKLVTSAPSSSTMSPESSTSAVTYTTTSSAPISTSQISTPSSETTKTAESKDSIEATTTNAVNTTEAPKSKTTVKISVSTDGISTIKPTTTGKEMTVTSSQPLSSSISTKSTTLPTSATSSIVRPTSPKVSQTTTHLVSTTLKFTDLSTTMSTSSAASTSIKKEIISSTSSTITPGKVTTNSVSNPTQLSTEVQTKSTTNKPTSADDQTTFTSQSTTKVMSSSTTETTTETTPTTTTPETSPTYVKTTAKPLTETTTATTKQPSSVITGSSPPQKSTKRSNSLTTKSIITSNSSKDNSISVSEQRSEHPADETLKPLLIGLGVGIVAGLIIIGVIAYVCVRRRKFYTSRYEDELKPITNSASVQSLNGSNGHFYQDGDYEAES